MSQIYKTLSKACSKMVSNSKEKEGIGNHEIMA